MTHSTDSNKTEHSVTKKNRRANSITMSKWQSLNDVINADRLKKTGVEYIDAPRYGERRIEHKPRRNRDILMSDMIQQKLEKHMRSGTTYKTVELRQIVNKPRSYNLARDMKKYPNIFKCIERGVWKLK